MMNDCILMRFHTVNSFILCQLIFFVTKNIGSANSWRNIDKIIIVEIDRSCREPIAALPKNHPIPKITSNNPNALLRLSIEILCGSFPR